MKALFSTAGMALAVWLAFLPPGFGEESKARGVIRAIEILPPVLQSQLKDAIEAAVVLRVGSPFEMAKLTASEELIRTIPKVESVKSEVEESPEGVSVRFHIKAKARITKFIFVGNDSISRGTLQKQMGVTRGQYFTGALRRVIVDRIRELYRDRGFFRAAVRVDEIDAGPGESAVRVQIDEGELWRIGEIKIEGVTLFDSVRLNAILGVTSGDPYSKEAMERGLNELRRAYRDLDYLTARVSEPTMKLDPQEPLVHLGVEVEEGPEVRLVIDGGELRVRRLLELLGVDEGARFSRWSIDEAADILRSELRRRGFAHATVTPEMLEDSADRLWVHFHVQRGPKVYLSRVEFRGTEGMADGELQEELFTLLGSAYRRRPFNEAVFRERMNQLLRRYRERGYYDAKISGIEIRYPVAREQAVAEIRIDEGERANLREIEITGNQVLSRTELERLLALPVGEPINLYTLDGAKDRILQSYREKGYLKATVGVGLDVSGSATDARVRIDITEGAQYRVGQIIVTGNEVTHTPVIRRELRVRSGEIFSPKAVTDSQSRIQRSGLFRSVVIEELYPATEDRPLVHLLVTVRERARISLEFGPGFGTEDGPRAVVDAQVINIMGTGRKLGVRTKVNRQLTANNEAKFINDDREDRPFIERNTTINYFEPHLLDSEFSGQASISEFKTMGTFLDRHGVNLTLGMTREALREMYLHLQYRVEYSNPFNVQRRADESVSTDLSRRKLLNSIMTGADYSFLDDIVVPTRGWSGQETAELFSEFVGSDENFWILSSRNDFFIPLKQWIEIPSVFAFSVRFGFSREYSDTELVPVEKQFRLGGEETVRGFQPESINPLLTSGQAFFNYRMEINIPIIYRFELLVFHDAGNIYRRPGAFRPWDLRYTVGPGIRWNTPVGPLKAGLGFILGRQRIPTPNGKEREPWGAFFFGVGSI